MSRIDEALRQARQGGTAGPAALEPAAGAGGQKNFAPAWSLAEGAAAPVAEVSEGESTSVLESAVIARSPQGSPLEFSTAWRERLAGGATGNPELTEQFRRLAATLHHAQRTNGLKSVAITSAVPGDGKTLTAVNLALVLAESYRARVLLIDADLRRPSIPSVVDLGEGSGLSEALRSAREQKLALVPLTPRLTLLPAGQPIANSIEALTSPRMRQILEEAVTRYDWVILDAPPVGPAADARLLTQMVGGTLFVIHAGQTQYPVVQKAIDFIGRDQILGVVLNGVDARPGDPYYTAYSTR